MHQMIKVTSPHDGSLIDTIEQNSAAEIESKLSKARQLFDTKSRWLSPHERIKKLEALALLLESQAEKFALQIAQEGGKPLIDAHVEVTRAVAGIKEAASQIGQVFSGHQIPMGLSKATEGRSAFTIREPIGVVVAISAFNHPLNLIVHQVVPALAVGCPVLVKPALATPLCCRDFVALVEEAGFEPDWCQMLISDHEEIQSVLRDTRVNFLTFIGSAKVGWMLRRVVAPGVRCALEHGGVAPVIVDETANLDKVIPALAKGGYYHAGQVCVSVQRVFVHENIKRGLVERLKHAVSELRLGDPSLMDTEVGPLIHPTEVDRVHEWVSEAVNAGARLVAGGEKHNDYYYQPTLLEDAPDTVLVSQQEVFGPVVSVYSYKQLSEAIEKANNTEFAFQAAIFTEDLKNMKATVEALDATAVMVNDHTAFRADWMPFGGRRSSGLGLGGIPYAMGEMTQTKMVVLN